MADYASRKVRGRASRLVAVPDGPSNARTITSGSGDLLIAPLPEHRYSRDLHPIAGLREVWAVREIVRTLAERDLRVRYKQAVLGFAWSLVGPLSLLVAFTLIFHHTAHVDTQGISYPVFAYTGLIAWGFFSSTVGGGGSSLLADMALLNKTYFPREVFPLNAAIVAMFDAFVGLIPLVVLMAIHHIVPGRWIFLVPFALVVLLAFAIGCAFIASSVIVFYRDLRLALPLALQMGLFLTPIGYSVSFIPHEYRFVYAALDPVAPVIEAIRSTLLLDQPPNWADLGIATCSAVVVLAAGWTLFKRLEPGFADVV